MSDDESRSAETRENLIQSVRRGSRYGAVVWLTIGLILWAEGGKPAFITVLVVGGIAQGVLSLYLSTRLHKRTVREPDES